MKLDPAGRLVQTWDGFFTVTGVAVGDDGSMYVSELFSGFGASPDAPPLDGGVTKIGTDGSKTKMTVPFPAGVAVDSNNNVYVSAFSIATEFGLDGTDASSGQIWRLKF